jgi:hypothetical protein
MQQLVMQQRFIYLNHYTLRFHTSAATASGTMHVIGEINDKHARL